MKILFLSRWFPYPATNGSKLRIYSLLRELAREHHVTLLSLIDDPTSKINTGGIDTIVDEVRTAPLRVFKPDGVRARSGLLRARPRFIVDTSSPVFANLIRETIASKPFDLVLASQIDTAMYRNEFRAIPAIFEEVEAAILYERFVLAESWHRRLRAGLTWLKHRRYLASLLSRFQAALSPPRRSAGWWHGSSAVRRGQRLYPILSMCHPIPASVASRSATSAFETSAHFF
jgi:polysaccharide biosynthesis protein PslH